MMSNISIANSQFINNKARVGAAVHIDCSPPHTCFTSISGTLLANNSALKKGGGIYYNLQRPEIDSTIFDSNSAPYGPDIASYAVKVVREGSTDNQIYINNVGSGIKYEEDLKVMALDSDNQVMNQESGVSVKIIPVSSTAKVGGIVNQGLSNGTATFSNMIFKSAPGDLDVNFKFVSSLLDTTRIKYGTNIPQSNLFVSFRH